MSPVRQGMAKYRNTSGFSSDSGDLHFDPLPEPNRIVNTIGKSSAEKHIKDLKNLLAADKESSSGLGGLNDIKYDPNSR